MTLAQLQSFVLVARLGSVKAAAAELEVTEPAVSVAVGAVRKELGDDLFVRERRGIALTPGGRRLAALASEILGLAEQARRSVHESAGAPMRMQVVATSLVAEILGPLIDAFTAREDGLEVAVEAVAGAAFGDLLEHRRADVALGPHPGPERVARIASAPFLRCRLVMAPRRPIPSRARARSLRRRSRASAGSSASPSSTPPPERGSSSRATASSRARRAHTAARRPRTPPPRPARGSS
jgi:DNA-binding transcriptional LysR family regulator